MHPRRSEERSRPLRDRGGAGCVRLAGAYHHRDEAVKIAITLLVVVHLVATLWHGDAHSTLEVFLPALKNLFIYTVILAGPVVGAILVWTRFFTLGAGLVAVSMTGALVFGVYHHYILVSPDNIAHLPAGTAAAHAQFIDSAALIAIIELVSALYAFYALGQARAAESPRLSHG